MEREIAGWKMEVMGCTGDSSFTGRAYENESPATVRHMPEAIIWFSPERTPSKNSAERE